MADGALALLPICEKVMNNTGYEGCKIAENETTEILLLSARSRKRICEVKKADTSSVFVAEFQAAEEFAILMWQFKQKGTIRK